MKKNLLPFTVKMANRNILCQKTCIIGNYTPSTKIYYLMLLGNRQVSILHLGKK